MIPQSALPDTSQLDTAETSRTYRLDLKSKRIAGMVDGLDAVIQAVYKILLTERYAYLIYNWAYGVEVLQYIGAEHDFVAADLPQIITEALIQDDRVISVGSWKINRTKIDALYVEFTVESTAGNAQIEWEVSL